MRERGAHEVHSKKEGRKDTMSCAGSSITSQRELQNPFWFHLPLSRSLSDNFSGLVAATERHIEMDG